MRSLILLVCLLAACTVPPPEADLYQDFDIAVGAPDATGFPTVLISNNRSSLQRFNLGHMLTAIQQHLPASTGWDPVGLEVPSACGGSGGGYSVDQFITYHPSRREFYASRTWFHPDNRGWCVGRSQDLGTTWSWTVQSFDHEVDGGRITWTADAIVISTGGNADPVFWYPLDGAPAQSFALPLVNRIVVRTLEDGPTALVAGIDQATATVRIARLWPDGHSEMSNAVTTLDGQAFVERVKDDPDSLAVFSLNDAWLDRVHNVVWLAMTTACPYTRSPVHACAAFMAVRNYSAAHSFDDPTVWTLTGGLPLSQLDSFSDPWAQAFDTWLPRVTTDDQGNALFTATISGPALYPTAIGGGITLADQERYGSQPTTASLLNQYGQVRLPVKNGAVWHTQDFNGIAPDPNDRRYAWSFSASTWSTVTTPAGQEDVTFYGNLVEFGRLCDPATRRCG